MASQVYIGNRGGLRRERETGRGNQVARMEKRKEGNK